MTQLAWLARFGATIYFGCAQPDKRIFRAYFSVKVALASKRLSTFQSGLSSNGFVLVIEHLPREVWLRQSQ